MNLNILIIIVSILLIILWLYSALTKLGDFKKFKQSMLSQIFPKWMSRVLVYTLPLVELSIAILLLFPHTRLIGMYTSLLLMLSFTLYVGGAVYHIYGNYPCACGGLFTKLGWSKHFHLNIGLTLLALIGVILMEV